MNMKLVTTQMCKKIFESESQKYCKLKINTENDIKLESEFA